MPDKRNRVSLVFVKEYPPKFDWYNSITVYEDLVILFESANKSLFKKDLDLIKNDVSERTICGALMIHLKSALWGTPFRKYYVDVEYNRNKDGMIKTIIE